MRSLTSGILINRFTGDPIFELLLREGYKPISFPLTVSSFNRDLPSQLNDALSQNTLIDTWIITSPTSARLVEPFIPEGCTILATKASQNALTYPKLYDVIISNDPSSESMLELIRSHRPSGGDFLLVHGHRSRQLIEKSFMNTEYRISTIISHVEIENPDPLSVPSAGAYLALSPLQAELFHQKTRSLFPIGWGKLLERTFLDQGLVEYRVCDPTLFDLHTLLKDIYEVH